jgi:hypothetical protein
MGGEARGSPLNVALTALKYMIGVAVRVLVRHQSPAETQRKKENYKCSRYVESPLYSLQLTKPSETLSDRAMRKDGIGRRVAPEQRCQESDQFSGVSIPGARRVERVSSGIVSLLA